jgi:hypothetical protein
MKDRISRKMQHDRLHEWNKTHHPDEFPESSFMDKAVPNSDHKSTKSKKKVWWLEFQWKSEKDFNIYKKDWWFFLTEKVYNEEWRKNTFGNKFVRLQDLENSFRTMNQIEGRNWRGRNTETGEIKTL